MVLFGDGTPVIVQCAESKGFKLQPEDLERAITPKTKWIIMNSPATRPVRPTRAPTSGRCATCCSVIRRSMC